MIPKVFWQQIGLLKAPIVLGMGFLAMLLNKEFPPSASLIWVFKELLHHKSATSPFLFPLILVTTIFMALFLRTSVMFFEILSTLYANIDVSCFNLSTLHANIDVSCLNNQYVVSVKIGITIIFYFSMMMKFLNNWSNIVSKIMIKHLINGIARLL